MKKYALFVVAILALVVFASGCTDQTKTYSSNGITFNYPGSWQELSQVNNENGIAGVGDPSSVNSSSKLANTVVVVQKVAMPSGLTLQEAVDALITSFQSQDPNFQKISQKTITFNGATAYEIVYKMGANGVQKQEKAVIFEKNGYLYAITGSSLPNDFNNQQANFDMVINSFKVQ